MRAASDPPDDAVRRQRNPRCTGAPRSTKMGTIRSPWRYDAVARHALQSALLRRPAISSYASGAIREIGDDGGSGFTRLILSPIRSSGRMRVRLLRKRGRRGGPLPAGSEPTCNRKTMKRRAADDGPDAGVGKDLGRLNLHEPLHHYLHDAAVGQLVRAVTPFTATWRSGYAAVCKTVYPGSIPGGASKKSMT